VPGVQGLAAAARVARGAGRRPADPRVLVVQRQARAEWIAEVELTERERDIARLILREIDERLRFLDNVGIGYLSMDRTATTLSGGEAQRIRLATQIGSALVGVLYVLDEPSIGLHQRDNSKLITTLERLRELGNTVLVVEHDEQTMRQADHLIDMGPGAGEHGGRVVASGTAEEVCAVEESLTGQFLSACGRSRCRRSGASRPATSRSAGPASTTSRTSTCDVPLGRLHVRHRRVGLGQVDAGQRRAVQVGGEPAAPGAAAAGRARQGAGARPARQDHPGRPVADRAHAAVEPGDLHGPVRRHPRPVLQDAGGAGARVQAGRFSFNVKGGRCEVCRGDGQIKIEMHFLPDVYVPCEQCHGKRYNRETLDIRFKGKTIADVLDMPVEEAVEFFQHIPKIRRGSRRSTQSAWATSGSGQPATTLSGGEAQRVKLATELSKIATGATLYILDEPTTGLHFADVAAPARGAAAAGRPGQLGRRDRAQPRRHQERRPDHRHGPRGRGGGRHGRRRRHARGGRGDARLVHRRVPRRPGGAGGAEGAPDALARRRRPRPPDATRGTVPPVAR
jgi:excinuclease ABC subunit A